MGCSSIVGREAKVQALERDAACDLGCVADSAQTLRAGGLPWNLTGKSARKPRLKIQQADPLRRNGNPHH